MISQPVSPEVRWLSPQEMAAWRGLQQMHAHLTAQLGRKLFEASGLSAPDYAVLVQLSEQPDGRLRAFELGRELAWEKSRLSHHVGRMEQRGLVERVRCPHDQRGLFVAITPEGRRVLEAAAPAHVADVRHAFVDRLTPEQLAVMAEVTALVMSGLECPDAACDGD